MVTRSNTVTEKEIREAHRAGKLHGKDYSKYWSYYTGVLQSAYDAGFRGQELSDNVSVCKRYGKLPKSGYSINYSTNEKEHGVSVIEVDGKKEGHFGAELWMSDRSVVRFKGILIIDAMGSDGEQLVLPIEYYENMDD